MDSEPFDISQIWTKLNVSLYVTLDQLTVHSDLNAEYLCNNRSSTNGDFNSPTLDSCVGNSLILNSHGRLSLTNFHHMRASITSSTLSRKR